MATLTRPEYQFAELSTSNISSNIPSPFPIQQLQRPSRVQPPQQQQETTAPEATSSSQDAQKEPILKSSVLEERQQQEEYLQHESIDTEGLDLIPSIANVQKTCIMALNDLLSSTQGFTDVPDRRHSMPPLSSCSADAPNYIALQTLVSNLRNMEPHDQMVETHTYDSEQPSDTALLHELSTRVSSLSHTLADDDARLATAIISLLSHLRRISIILSSSTNASSSTPRTTTKQLRAVLDDEQMDTSSIIHLANPFDALKRELSDFQTETLASRQGDASTSTPPVLVVETALLWSRIDEELETILSLSKNSTHNPRYSYAPSERGQPPEYDEWYDREDESLPEYEHGARASLDDKKSQISISHASSADKLNEKTRMDLEAVATAIDRLYLTAPQLHNQRVELKSSKLLQMERARSAGPTSTSMFASTRRDAKGKQKAMIMSAEVDPKEIERMFELIGKASERKYTDQTVVLRGGMKSQLEKAEVRDRVKRNAFVEKLGFHSDAGRYHGQDAILQPGGRIKDPEALLTLPEFVRESVPLAYRVQDQEVMLTLPEFIRESNETYHPEREQSQTRSAGHEHSIMPATSGSKTPPTHARQRSLRAEMERRSRSMSAPSLSWLKSSSPKLALNAEAKASAMSPSNSSPNDIHRSTLLEVNYVAEHHENLHHILVFLSIQGGTDKPIDVEILPSLQRKDEGDRMIVRCGLQASLPLPLPACTIPGKKSVQCQSGFYEIKLPTVNISSFQDSMLYHQQPILDATQLTKLHPQSFACWSCSLPLVQASSPSSAVSSKIASYRDLPSEHWEELVDAWMCHSDMKLNDEIVKRKDGFWPDPGEVLVGGSYCLFRKEVVVSQNMAVAQETKPDQDWRVVRCICGAIIGRCQPHRSDPLGQDVYRLVKYAIRPVSIKHEPTKLPLSAFIIEDMNEFVQAHATYRFVILDEEDEKPRLLLWLFKPHMRLAYATPKQYSIPKSASILSSKILYKILKPDLNEQPLDLKTIVSKYPGFPQAEHIHYPIGICRQLAAMLRESTNAYPERMRTMTGLEVGWLTRA